MGQFNFNKKHLIIMSMLILTAIGIYIYSGMIKSKAAVELQTVRYLLENKCDITLSEQSSWKESNTNGRVVNVSLKNIDTDTMQGWSIKIVWNGDITIDQAWCAEKKVEGNIIELSSLEYNKSIANGQSISMGFIIKSANNIDYNKVELYFNGEKVAKASEVTPTKKPDEVITTVKPVETSKPIVTVAPVQTSLPAKTTKTTVNSKERYFTEKLSVSEMKSRSEAIPKSEVKQLLYNEIDEHWDVLSAKLGQKDKKKVYALFLGFATRESTLNAGVETAQEQGFGVNPAHAFGPLQTAVTAFKGCNASFMKENDVPELLQYDWNEANFYDPIVSTHMGVRKLIHFVNEAQSYGLKDVEVVRNALKGFNTGHANPESDNTAYYESYPDEIAAMAGWYYKNNHYDDDVFTWTSDPKVDRADCWKWWK